MCEIVSREVEPGECGWKVERGEFCVGQFLFFVVACGGGGVRRFVIGLLSFGHSWSLETETKFVHAGCL